MASQMTQTHWEYYGRDGALGIYELFRCPSDKKGAEKFQYMQRLKQGGIWADASTETALRNEWLSGWFDFDDNRLEESEARRLAQEWAQREKWPGRP